VATTEEVSLALQTRLNDQIANGNFTATLAMFMSGLLTDAVVISAIPNEITPVNVTVGVYTPDAPSAAPTQPPNSGSGSRGSGKKSTFSTSILLVALVAVAPGIAYYGRKKYLSSKSKKDSKGKDGMFGIYSLNEKDDFGDSASTTTSVGYLEAGTGNAIGTGARVQAAGAAPVSPRIRLKRQATGTLDSESVSGEGSSSVDSSEHSAYFGNQFDTTSSHGDVFDITSDVSSAIGSTSSATSAAYQGTFFRVTDGQHTDAVL
jgi:hypothetical protein